MSQDNKDKAGTRKSQMMKISINLLIIVLLFLIEIYEIINDPNNLIAIGVLGVFVLTAVYTVMLFIGKLNEIKATDQEEAFDNVYRSEKASYLLMRKYFDQMEQKMDTFGEKASLPYRELVSAQKALAKVQINHNKQNANALLISNDKVLQKLDSVQKEIANINTDTNLDIGNIDVSLNEQDKAVFTEGNKDILEKQQEILAGLKELENSLRNEMLESVDKLTSMKSQQVVTSMPQMPLQENSELHPLDMDTELSLDSDLTSQHIMENSSESDLDKLLMGLDSGMSDASKPESMILEPELGSMMEGFESELAPMTENMEPELGSIMEDPELAPIVENIEPELGSIMGDPELAPIVENIEPELGSIMEESELAPMMESMEPESGSILEEPELAPIMESVESELPPMIENVEAETDAILEEPELAPIMENMESELGSIPQEQELELMTENVEPELSSIMEEPEPASMTENMEPELGSIMEEPELAPMTENMEPELGSIMEESELASMTENMEPELGSIMEEPELAPMTENMESELGSIMEEPELASMTENIEPELGSIMEEPELAPMTEDMEPELSSILKDMEMDFGTLEQESESQSLMKDQQSESITEISKEETEPAKVKIPDLSDPNHELTPAELAAMVANLGTDQEPVFESEEENPSMVSETKVKAESEEKKEKPAIKRSSEAELDQIMKAMEIDSVAEEPLEDLDIDKILEVPLAKNKENDFDDNQVMSSEEIAALIANTSFLSDPESNKMSDLPDLSDPGHVMSSDEIAALIANM